MVVITFYIIFDRIAFFGVPGLRQLSRIFRFIGKSVPDHAAFDFSGFDELLFFAIVGQFLCFRRRVENSRDFIDRQLESGLSLIEIVITLFFRLQSHSCCIGTTVLHRI